MGQIFLRDGEERTVERVDFTGTWTNERGSVMVLDHHGNQLVGTYRTGVGDPDKAEAFVLTGFAFGAQATFSVDFSRYGSMTSWVGFVEGGALKTLWQLVRVPDTADEAWSSIRAGASTFTRAATP